jgi:HK97 family phage portal protein
VLHFANTFRYQNGFWGMSTIKYAADTLSLIRTESNQALETAAKGGRVKLIVGEEKPAQGGGTLAAGLFSKGEIDKYARELNDRVYQQDIVGIRGLSALHNISMSAQDMQLMEHMNMGLDDVARYFGTPRPLLMLDTNSHYTTYTNATLEYLQRTVQPDITEMEQEMNRKLLTRDDFGKRRIHMCEQPLLRLDKEAQAKVDQLQLQTGAATVNEIRAQYDRPSVEGGDTIYVSTNLAELGSPKLSGAQPAPAEPKPEEP